MNNLLFQIERLSLKFAIFRLRKTSAVFSEYHGRCLWSKFSTTRLYRNGYIEPIYAET